MACKKSYMHMDYIMGGIIVMCCQKSNWDDHVIMRKPHPCGSYEWKVVRLGADIGLECCQCSRRIMLSRRELANRLKKLLPGAANEFRDNK